MAAPASHGKISLRILFHDNPPEYRLRADLSGAKIIQSVTVKTAS
jgi:hypothetical protein